MPLKGTFGDRVKELIKDNNKKGKARSNKGKKRSMKQILAIAYSSMKSK
jgi:hypothetical protein